MNKRTTKIFSGIAADIITGDYSSAKNKVKEECENKILQGKALKEALEGEKSEVIKEQLKELATAWQEEMEKAQTGYSDKELEEIFEEQYKELYGESEETREDKNKLCQRFLIYSKECLEHMAKGNSFAEQELLRKTGIIQEEVETGCRTAEEIQKISKENSAWLNRLCKDIDAPLLEVDNLGMARVRPYHMGFMAMGNTIVLDETRDRISYENDIMEDVYIMTLPVKNVGHAAINQIECTNLTVSFCGGGDLMAEGIAMVLPVVEHDKKAGCYMNIAPSSVQKLNFVVTWKEEDEEEESRIKEIQTMYDWGMLYVEMGLIVSAEERKTEYRVCLFLEKPQHWHVEIENEDDVPPEKKMFVGKYEIAEVWMERK